MAPMGDYRLYYIEQIDHRQHAIKIARRGEFIELLLYPPGEMFATRMIVEPLANYESAIARARAAIAEMIRTAELAKAALQQKAAAADRALRRAPRLR